MVNNVKAVFFDMDGTLIDSEQYWITLFDSIVAKYNKTFTPEDRNAFFGCSHETEIEIMTRYLETDEEGVLREKRMYIQIILKRFMAKLIYIVRLQMRQSICAVTTIWMVVLMKMTNILLKEFI